MAKFDDAIARIRKNIPGTGGGPFRDLLQACQVLQEAQKPLPTIDELREAAVFTRPDGFPELVEKLAPLFKAIHGEDNG